jgi:hypothetical protein
LAPFEDIRGDVFTWLPAVQVHVHGCGVTPFNVMELSFDWWRVYRAIAVAAVEAEQKLAKKQRGRNG